MSGISATSVSNQTFIPRFIPAKPIMQSTGKDKVVSQTAEKTFENTNTKEKKWETHNDIIELKPAMLDEPAIDEINKTPETPEKKSIALKLKAAVKKVIEFVETSETFILLFSKETNTIHNTEGVFKNTQASDKATSNETYVMTGLVDTFFLFLGIKKTVTAMKEAYNIKAEIKNLNDEVEKSKGNIHRYDTLLNEINTKLANRNTQRQQDSDKEIKNDMLPHKSGKDRLEIGSHREITPLQSGKDRPQRPIQSPIAPGVKKERRKVHVGPHRDEITYLKHRVHELKNKEVINLWETQKKLAETEEKRSILLEKIPLLSAGTIALGMKVVSAVSDVLKCLNAKGAIARTAGATTLAFTAGAVLIPIASVISVVISGYLTYKAVQEYRKNNEEIAKVDNKISKLHDLAKTPLPPLNLRDQKNLGLAMVGEYDNLKLKQTQLKENKRLIALNIASQSTLLGANVVLLGANFSGPLSPYFLGGGIALLLVSTGLSVYSYFSGKNKQKEIEKEFADVKLHPNDITQLTASLANSISLDTTGKVAEELHRILDLNDQEKEELSMHPVEFLSRHFKALQQSLST